MNITTLQRKARDGSLEVEHLLQAAAESLLGLSEELSRLGATHGWQLQGMQPDGTRVVPFARWAAVASAYASHGFPGLRELAREPDEVPFVLGLLEHVFTNESVAFAIEICEKFLSTPEWPRELGFRVTATLNLLLSFKRAAPVTETQARAIQDFLLALYPRAQTEAERAVVILALRGIGDEGALRFIEAAADFTGAWSGTKEPALRAVRKRIKASAR
jgi:hypothetical protein